MEQILNFLQKAADYSEKSRREGLLSLEDDTEKSCDIFNFGIKLAIDGANTEYISRILTNMIEQEKDSKTKRIKAVQKEAVLLIQAGYDTRILLFILSSYLNYNEQSAFQKAAGGKYDIPVTGQENGKSMGQNEFIKNIVQIILKAYTFSVKSRREGLLSLEDETEDLDDPVFKTGIRLVVDGTDCEIIKKIIINMINNELNETRRRLLTVTLEAILSIQAGDNSEVLLHKLLSHLTQAELKTAALPLSKLNFSRLFGELNTAPIEKVSKKFTQQAADIIYRAYKFTEKAEENGILGLEEDIDSSRRARLDIFEYGVQFTVDGVDDCLINEILSNLIELEDNEEIKKLKTIQKEAVLNIHKRENLSVFIHSLISYLSDSELQQVLEHLSKTDIAQIFNTLLENPLIDQKTLDETNKRYANDLDESIGSQEVIDFFNKPLDITSDIDPSFLSEFLKQESPQNAALLFAYISSGYCSEGGIQTIADILKHVDFSSEKRIISPLEEEEPELAEAIFQYLYSFEDIVNFDGRTIQKIMREIDSQELVMALKGADKTVQEKIFTNMSMRAAATLKEDMEYMGHVRHRDINRARQRITSVIRRLKYSEVITI